MPAYLFWVNFSGSGTFHDDNVPHWSIGFTFDATKLTGPLPEKGTAVCACGTCATRHPPCEGCTEVHADFQNVRHAKTNTPIDYGKDVRKFYIALESVLETLFDKTLRIGHNFFCWSQAGVDLDNVNRNIVKWLGEHLSGNNTLTWTSVDNEKCKTIDDVPVLISDESAVDVNTWLAKV